MVQEFSCVGLVSLLYWLQRDWGIIGRASLGVEVAQCLMQWKRGFQAAALLPNTQELLNTFNRL